MCSSMALADATTQYAIAGTTLILLASFLLFQPNSFVKWLQKKNYQYEVTFSLYMLTPTEKFIFSQSTLQAPLRQKGLANELLDSVLFLMLSMFSIMCFLYLPNHVVTMSRRAFYYFAGDAQLADASKHLSNTAIKASEAVKDTATDLAGAAYQATVHTAMVAQEAVNQAAENLG